MTDDDPIVEEARRAGEELFARFGNDMHAVCEYLRRRAREEGRHVVSMPPKRPEGWQPPAATKKAS